MPQILSVGTAVPQFEVTQDKTMEIAKQLFSGVVNDLDHLLKVFLNGEIKQRYFAKEIEWYLENHSFSEKNNVFLEEGVKLCIASIQSCLHAAKIRKEIQYSDIDAIFLINSTGLTTPSLDARIMNRLPFSSHLKRVPIWGLGCGGGVAGLSRAYEYCLAYPNAKVLVVAVELCSLTFQKEDFRKSNIVGTSLFADGAATVLVVGDDVNYQEYITGSVPSIVTTQSTLMQDSLDVMGWDIRDNGLYVIFSKEIPSLVQDWLEPVVGQFLNNNGLSLREIDHFIAHPGGKKVIKAFENAWKLDKEKTANSLEILKEYGNMSSVTIFFVLEKFLGQNINPGEYGIMVALGPGFSSELALVRWI